MAETQVGAFSEEMQWRGDSHPGGRLKILTEIHCQYQSINPTDSRSIFHATTINVAGRLGLKVVGAMGWRNVSDGIARLCGGQAGLVAR